MKTSLKKLLNHHNKHNSKERKIQPLVQSDELAKTSEAMQDMKDCYDSLLSAAAAATNSAYEFSESLREMGVCLLQKIALNDDEESGKVMLMLGKVQFELQKLVDSYRNHIYQTITVPSESLINELHTVEEMKHQCDEKRNLFEYMRTNYREKGRSKSGKGETFSLQQVQAAKDEFDEEATLFVFRLKSLKQGQSRSLLTQAARHHAAQLSFFRKAVKSLEAVEPHVNLVTHQQHIDYQFTGLDDDESEDVEDYDDSEDDDVSSTSSMEDEEELRSGYQRYDRQLSYISAAKGNMEGNMKAIHEDSFIREKKILSQSAPLFTQRKFEPAERIKLMQPSRKFHSYALPKPGDTSRASALQTKALPLHAENFYHSSPLEPNKYEEIVRTETLSGPIILSSKSVLKESNNIRMPPPLTEGISVQQLKPEIAMNSKKLKLQSFSVPLTSKPLSTKPSLSTSNHISAIGVPPFSSGPILRSTVHRSASSPVISPTTSPTFTSPRINELHELPRPPVHLIYGSGRPLGTVGHSAPLVFKSSENSSASKISLPKLASPLPTPPRIGYYSMPLSGAGTATKSPPSRPSETSSSSDKSGGIFSPTSTPMMLKNQNPTKS